VRIGRRCCVLAPLRIWPTYSRRPGRVSSERPRTHGHSMIVDPWGWCRPPAPRLGCGGSGDQPDLSGPVAQEPPRTEAQDHTSRVKPTEAVTRGLVARKGPSRPVPTLGSAARQASAQSRTTRLLRITSHEPESRIL
jgi:hypothetical protein